jgi:hypothetical protein
VMDAWRTRGLRPCSRGALDLPSHRLARAAVLVAALSVAGGAHAAPTAADRETARTLMDQGRDLRDKGNLQEALKRFQAANDIMHVPTTAIEVAKTQVALGLLVEARDTVAALRQIPANHESQLFKDARTKAEALDASLSGRVPSLTISLKGPAPGDTEVAVDGVVVPSGVLGLPRSVDPGHHVITAKGATAEAKEEIDVREGEQKPVQLALIVTAPAPVVETPPPSTDAEAPAKKSHKPTALTFVGVGVAAAGAIAGTVTGIMAISKKSSLVSQCPNEVCGPSSYSALDSANLLATVSDVSFGVGGAGAVLAIVTLVVGHKEGSQPPPPPSAGWTVTPWIGGGEAGVRGSF